MFHSNYDYSYTCILKDGHDMSSTMDTKTATMITTGICFLSLFSLVCHNLVAKTIRKRRGMRRGNDKILKHVAF